MLVDRSEQSEIQKIFPPKLKIGNEVRVIAPSTSLAKIPQYIKENALSALEQLGLKVTFGKNVEEINYLGSSSIKDRIEDLHSAFRDNNVKAIIAAEGGFNSNQLLRYIDWKIIKNNPKIVCGFSDITALINAITAKTGIVTYNGPDFSTFGEEKGIQYIQEYFKKCLFETGEYQVQQSNTWFDLWNPSSHDITKPLIRNKTEWKVMNLASNTEITGELIGGNLSTLNLLTGTKFIDTVENKIVFLEDDFESNIKYFARDLHSFFQQKGIGSIKALLIGRFQAFSDISEESLIKTISSVKVLKDVPVIYNMDFGHTSPLITIPVGGTCLISQKKGKMDLKLIKH